MATIKDLLALQKDHVDSVEIQGLSFPVRPVGMIDILRIIGRFPELKQVFFGADERTLIDIVVSVGPDAIAAFLAVATGQDEKDFVGLDDESLIAFLSKAIKVTMPDGIEGFLQKLVKLGSASGILKPEGQGESIAA